jgi:hypothetical protein
MTGSRVPWGHRPDLIIAEAKLRAKASKDGRGLTHLERSFWEAQKRNIDKQ